VPGESFQGATCLGKVIANLAAGLENRKKDVNAWLYWDRGHGADDDPEDFIAWIGKITGFTR